MTRISQFELAYRMQLSVPEVMDIGAEPDYIHEMYGTKPGTTSFANNCLLARRLVEKGPHGPLPRLGADGARPADVYARPVLTGGSLKPERKLKKREPSTPISLSAVIRPISV